MSWRQSTVELLVDILRFVIRGALLFNGSILGLASTLDVLAQYSVEDGSKPRSALSRE